MKKITLLSFILIFSTGIFAQSSFQVGFRVSPNLGWLKPTTKNIEYNGLKFGFNYGLMMDFNISDRYSFSTGIESSSIAGKLDYKNADTLFSSSTADIVAKYVEIPLTLKLKTNQIGYMTYYGQFGTALGINYQGKSKTTTTTRGSGVTTTTNDDNINEDLNLLRVGLVFAIGAEYNISGNTKIVGGITFNNGITNIFSKDARKSYKNIYNEDYKAISNYMALNIGVIF